MPAHRLSPSGPYLTAPEVANLADLAAFRDVSSDLVWVESLLCYWHLNATSALAPDGITVIAAATAGNWERIVETTAPDWLAEAAWVIDPALGDDENEGDAASPLATFDELNRRLSVGSIQQDTVVTVVAGAVCDHCVLDVDAGDFTFTIEGEPTTVTTDTIATYTDRNHATPAPPLLTASGIADLTPYEGMRVRVTDGAQVDAICWIGTVDPGGAGTNVARVCRFAQVFGTAVDPPDGSAFVIETLPFLGHHVSILIRTKSEAFNNNVLSVKSVGLGSHVEIGSQSAGYMVDGCDFNSAAALVSDFSSISPTVSAAFCTRAQFRGSAARFLFDIGVFTFLSRVTLFPVSKLNGVQLSGMLGDGAGFSSNLPPKLQLTTSNSQVFDAPIAIELGNGANVLTTSGLSGDGNGVGLNIGAATAGYSDNSDFSWNTAGNKPNLQGTTADIRIEGATDQLLSWADTPFNGDEQHGVGTLVGGTATVTARNASVRGVTVSKATPAGNPQGQLSAPTASRTTTQFVVNAIDATGALLASDTSTFDWHIPGTFLGIRLYERNSQG